MRKLLRSVARAQMKKAGYSKVNRRMKHFRDVVAQYLKAKKIK